VKRRRHLGAGADCHKPWETLIAFGIGAALTGTATYVIVKCPPEASGGAPSTTATGTLTGIAVGVVTSATTAILVAFLMKGFRR
jgi:hypothetical protein